MITDILQLIKFAEINLLITLVLLFDIKKPTEPTTYVSSNNKRKHCLHNFLTCELLHNNKNV